ncbi:alpha/beta hydrolase [Niabella sp. 22666]|uniref:alpha/beta hydrolase n=1 Tax=Niabella sp. 22666 TaxID=3453954 RepID=UPI003F85B8AA
MKNRIIKKVPVLLLVILFLAGCKKERKMTIDDNRIYQLERQELNISYGNHALQKMDIYFPQDFNANTPVAFVIHGGGFIAGTKEDFTDRAKLFMARGFITINISHRLVDATGLDQLPPPRINSAIKVADEVDDIAAAVEKYKTLAAGYGSGTSRMYMAGHSAGGTLAMLYVQGNKNLNKQVRASGNLAGLANVTLSDDLYNNPPDHEYWPSIKELLYRMSGEEPVKQNALHLMAISPNWVSSLHAPGLPNVTVMSNTNDQDLRFHPYFSTIDDARKYDEQLRSKGVKSGFVMMDTDHGFGKHPGDWETAIKHITNFFKSL